MRAWSLVAWMGMGVLAAGAVGCAEGVTLEQGEGGSSSSEVGSGGIASSSGGSGGTPAFPCGVDCSEVAAPACHVAECNTQTKQCEVLPDDGAACDDGDFCTVDDTCSGGQCMGGGPNDCGLEPGDCEDVLCDSTAQACSTTPKANGAPCTNQQNLCLVGTTCLNGSCQGTVNDCFFFPVPDDCHVAVCNPMNGMCEPQPGNEGQTCVDVSDLCTVNKTCAGGVCQGGGPKDCSNLTQGCNIGVCDTTTGSCVPQAVMNGDPCDDLNNCTLGELCNNGTCSGGTAITQCVANDGCCPSGCNQSNDADCSCNVNVALSATAAVNPGGGSSSPYDPARMNNGVPETCSEWAWMSNGVSSPGWASLTWSNVQTVGSMFIDGEHATMAACGTSGRDIASAEVQYQDVNNNWITVGTISGAENYMFTFPQTVQAKAVRLWNVFSSPGNGNTVIHEWYVWPGFNCPTPNPN